MATKWHAWVAGACCLAGRFQKRNSRLRSEEGQSTFEEIFLYACPKFITANGPPYDDPAALAQLLNPPAPSSPTSPSTPNAPISDPTHRHLRALTAHFLSLTPVPVLRSLLKLYTSLDARKLAGFLDAGVDEEEVLSWMMVMKNAGRCIGRVNMTAGADRDGEKGATTNGASSNGGGSLLDGEWMSVSDLNFVIDEVRCACAMVYDADLETEHDSHCRVDRWETVCRVVYPEFGACSAGVGWVACVAVASKNTGKGRR